MLRSCKRIVVSGINIFEGGPLSVMIDFLNALLAEVQVNHHKVTVFVHNRDAYKDYFCDFEVIELPKSRRCYLYRLYYEYIFFYLYSRNHKIDIWISMHDITPNVIANKRFVYCHNATPFLERSIKLWKHSKTIYLMSIFYRYIYKINLNKNNQVIVQQDWIRKKFSQMFGISNIIVAKPSIKINQSILDMEAKKSKDFTFIYSGYPRPFKNFETLCEASTILERRGYTFRVLLTIDGRENSYSQELYEKYSECKSIKWLGILDRDMLMRVYYSADCMVFPSLLESWGLPLTEFKEYGKPILCADLPYAHENIGGYKSVTFFNPYDNNSLANEMQSVMEGNLEFFQTEEIKIPQPYATSWEQLISMLL